MNVYDFDGTIYDGDSSIDFYLFCLRRHPWIARRLPEFGVKSVEYKLGRIDKTALKQSFFSFLADIRDTREETDMFWDTHQNRIKDWYVKQKKDSDVIISASPYFLVRCICNRIGICNVIASDVDIRTGFFRKQNCHDGQKLIEFHTRYPNAKIDEFYSDSKTDLPMAAQAERAFFVSKDTIIPWEV